MFTLSVRVEHILEWIGYGMLLRTSNVEATYLGGVCVILILKA